MPSRSIVPSALIASAILGSAAIIAVGGPLNPPAGPVASTHKTLTEIEPRIAINTTNTPGDANSLFRITAPGSYYLTADATVPGGRSGIEVATNGAVTIDLNGYTLTGLAASLNGISRDAAFFPSLVTITNGTLIYFGSSGIDITTYTRIDRVHARNNADRGFNVSSQSTLTDCHAHANLQQGFNATNNCRLINCSATNNQATGFAGLGSFIHCSAVNNAGSGFSINGLVDSCNAFDNAAIGFDLNGVSNALNCNARNNDSHGFRAVNNGATFQNCAAYNNDADGFNTSGVESVSLHNCISQANTGYGFNLSGSIAATITGCIASHSITLSGYRTGNRATLSACTSTGNALHGYELGDACTITHSAATTNTADGILASSDCFILNNTADGNGFGAGDAAGIHITGTGNRIQGNLVTDNDRGIDIDATTNVITQNVAGGNTTNYDIVASNRVGTIVVPPNSAAINGSTGGAGLGSTDPWANFTY